MDSKPPLQKDVCGVFYYLFQFGLSLDFWLRSYFRKARMISSNLVKTDY